MNATLRTPVFLSARALLRLAEDWHALDRMERVGVLIGHGRDIVDYLPLRNHDDRIGHFFVDPGQLAEAEMEAKAQGLELIGRFHTHPGRPCVPSIADRASLPKGWVELIAQVRVGRVQNHLVKLGAFDKRGRALPLEQAQVDGANEGSAA